MKVNDYRFTLPVNWIVKKNYLLGIPRLPLNTKEQIKSVTICDFVGYYSNFLIGALETCTLFFEYPVCDWQAKNKQNINGNEGIKMMHVLNDSVERGVRLDADFISKSQIAEIEDEYKKCSTSSRTLLKIAQRTEEYPVCDWQEKEQNISIKLTTRST